ncbi:alpha/beta hydrolase [Paenibacillus sp. SZ31]|uniref:alpha/beta fold hydrolase n=1 Tax=Paenibacillus sp. SZ31 TaxID=2725555 RepID=UPI00146D6EBF|nr:alpha/beta hydrolase [Paenibacillus sp. SZ31]NMI03369.1 alpha/beta hydrolase [Paenibacillus sp. SZ31]
MQTAATSSILINGYRIAYEQYGEGSPIWLLHGTPSYSYEWRKVIPALVQKGYKVYVHDLLGYGASERPLEADTSVAAQYTLFSQLLDELGMDRLHVVAHDLGGIVGLQLAQEQPERVQSLTLLNMPSYDSWPSPTWKKIIEEQLEQVERMPRADFDAMLKKQLPMAVYNKELMTGNTLDAYLAPHTGALGKASFFSHQVAHYNAKYTESYGTDLPKLKVPVQILWGEEDEWQPLMYAKRLVQDIPHACLHVIPKAGHFVMEDEPGQCSDYIDRFCNQHP